MKRVLLFTAKWPSVKKDTDGGSIMIAHLIDILKGKCILDGLFLRSESKEKIDGLNNIEFLNGDFLSYSTYNNKNDNKFQNRINNISYMANKIKSVIDNYDYIIIIHCLQAMGLSDLPEKQRKKIILFPMFLSESYIRSGDVVPKTYWEEEKKALEVAGKIITPSYTEFKEIVGQYQIAEEKITIIPRAIAHDFFCGHGKKLCNNIVQIVYIASFKNQKNNVEAIKLAKLLKEANLHFQLNLIGSIQDRVMYQKCNNYIIQNKLEKNVIIRDTVSQKQLADILRDMDINISVSRWETFGRGIFEGIAASLPTVIFKNIECVYDYIGENGGVLYVKDIEDMKNEICHLAWESGYYDRISADTMKSKSRFTVERQSELIMNTFFEE